jgi:peptidoglycan/xylan/chitin deacetylase (PgdA/CDA1 family)
MRFLRAAAAVSVVCAVGWLAWWQMSLLARSRRAPPPENCPPASPSLTPDRLRQLHVNEAGLVPVLMYHDITQHERYLGRSVAHFKHDLERLYAEGYRPISIEEYITNRIDLPAGTSPVILTFDDSRKSQFKYRADGSLDPDCAIAILNKFQEEHAGWRRKATFFLLPRCAFRQAGSDLMKLKLLVAWGYELGNHTVTHANLRALPDAGVRKEVAGCAQIIHNLVPDATVDALAFPGGRTPRNRALIAVGEWGGFRYANRVGFLAAEGPAPSPVSRKLTPLRIERIQACEGATGVDYWLDFLKTDRFPRYVSDGDPNMVTVPKRYAAQVDRARLRNCRFRTY